MVEDDRLPTPGEIINTHEEIEEAYDMKHRGVRATLPHRKLQCVIDGADEHEDVYVRAAHLLKRLIAIHIFEDGNKRTAFVVALEYLARHGQEVAVAPDDTEGARVLRSIGRYDVDELGTWLRTGDIDRSKLNPDGGQKYLATNPLLEAHMSEVDAEAADEAEHRERVRAIIAEYREVLDALQ